MQRIAGAQTALVARGFDPTAAHNAGIATLRGSVMQQATVMAFEKIFLLAGIAFLAVLPLLIFLRRGDDAPAKVHMEME
jgi:hypothetical protein